MSNPTLATIKRLFSVSGNRCAFPKCTAQLVDDNSGTVIGEICHIRARSQGGPRYDAAQTDQERHGFENLIIMCPIHHSVVDADEEAYTIERLLKIKHDHEQKSDNVESLPDPIAIKFISIVNSHTVNQGSIIYSQNQMGGQVAHTITNIGKISRSISHSAKIKLIEVLKQYPPERFKIISIFGDSESFQTASAIEQILREAGWISEERSQMGFDDLVSNIHIQVPQEKESLNELALWFEDIGFEPKGVIVPSLFRVEIIVGVRI